MNNMICNIDTSQVNEKLAEEERDKAINKINAAYTQYPSGGARFVNTLVDAAMPYSYSFYEEPQYNRGRLEALFAEFSSEHEDLNKPLLSPKILAFAVKAIVQLSSKNNFEHVSDQIGTYHRNKEMQEHESTVAMIEQALVLCSPNGLDYFDKKLCWRSGYMINAIEDVKNSATEQSLTLIRQLPNGHYEDRALIAQNDVGMRFNKK